MPRTWKVCASPASVSLPEMSRASREAVATPIVTPTAPTVAFKIGQKVNDPLSMYLNDIFTLPVNISGLPGISLPCGLSDGLPVGLQIIANSYQEATMFRVAAAYERDTKHHEMRPEVAA